MTRMRHPVLWTTAIGVIVLLAAAIVSLMLGTVRLSPSETFAALFAGVPGSAGAPSAPAADRSAVQAHAVVWSIRLPRIMVAMLVGAGGSNERHVQRPSRVEQVFLAVQFLDFDQIILGTGRVFSALLPGIDVRTDAYRRQVARAAPGYFPQPVHGAGYQCNRDRI